MDKNEEKSGHVKDTMKNVYGYCEFWSLMTTRGRLDGRVRGKWLDDDTAFLLGIKVLVVEFNFSLLMGGILGTEAIYRKMWRQ